MNAIFCNAYIICINLDVLCLEMPLQPSRHPWQVLAAHNLLGPGVGPNGTPDELKRRRVKAEETLVVRKVMDLDWIRLGLKVSHPEVVEDRELAFVGFLVGVEGAGREVIEFGRGDGRQSQVPKEFLEILTGLRGGRGHCGFAGADEGVWRESRRMSGDGYSNSLTVTPGRQMTLGRTDVTEAGR
jgi:hypothetical protein